MIDHIQGEILFSDGVEIIILTNSGIGYQINFTKVLAEGHYASLYISHIIKEASETLYGFETLREKKLFELLTTVKGVGPKGAYSLVSFLGTEGTIQAILFDDKKGLAKAPGIGQKAAAQIILDLQTKISKVKMYSNSYRVSKLKQGERLQDIPLEQINLVEAEQSVIINSTHLLEEAILACKELGFKEDKVRTIAQKVLQENDVNKAEQLVHLVLKGM
jgi:Holliday junction DNA helicase RuvA